MVKKDSEYFGGDVELGLAGQTVAERSRGGLIKGLSKTLKPMQKYLQPLALIQFLGIVEDAQFFDQFVEVAV